MAKKQAADADPAPQTAQSCALRRTGCAICLPCITCAHDSCPDLQAPSAAEQWAEIMRDATILETMVSGGITRTPDDHPCITFDAVRRIDTSPFAQSHDAWSTGRDMCTPGSQGSTRWHAPNGHRKSQGATRRLVHTMASRPFALAQPGYGPCPASNPVHASCSATPPPNCAPRGHPATDRAPRRTKRQSDCDCQTRA